MARKRIFNTNKFNGGMTNDIKDISDLSKCAFSSHFDIYGDPHEMKVMPGYVSDQAFDSDADGMKDYSVRCFWYDNQLNCAGTKLDGTGTKVFNKAGPEQAEWEEGWLTFASAYSEGSYDIADAPIARCCTEVNQGLWVTTTNGTINYWSYFEAGAQTDNKAVLSTGGNNETLPYQIVRGGADKSDTLYYTAVYGDLGSISDEVADTNVWDTGIYYITGLAESSRGLWTIGYTFQPYNTEVRLWDRNSALADQVIQIPNSRGGAIGVVGGVPVAVVDEFMDSIKGVSGSVSEQDNGLSSMAVHIVSGNSTDTMYRFSVLGNTQGEILPMNWQHKDAFTFYAKLPTDSTETEFRQGIWALGRYNSTQPIALSLLLDTTSLGSIEGLQGFSHHAYFAHAGDGSISRLDEYNTGDYDITAIFETLSYGADTPNDKQLNGITLKTNELPSGATVEMFYRTDPLDSWASMGTSTTDGDKVHNFTKPSAGGEVGSFQEIQFKFEVLGEVTVTNLTVSVNELDTLPYNL